MQDGTFVNMSTGALSGDNMRQSATTIADMQGFYENEEARQAMPQDTVLYRVQMHAQEAEDTVGGLFFGTSFLQPGLLGGEYFMTKGHYHSKRGTAEYYWCIGGEGLLLMDESGKTTWRTLAAGAVCYIPPHMAHRLVNTGTGVLTVGACWPSDAGHDYAAIQQSGFGVRVKQVDGKPTVLEA